LIECNYNFSLTIVLSQQHIIKYKESLVEVYIFANYKMIV